MLQCGLRVMFFLYIAAGESWSVELFQLVAVKFYHLAEGTYINRSQTISLFHCLFFLFLLVSLLHYLGAIIIALNSANIFFVAMCEE